MTREFAWVCMSREKVGFSLRSLVKASSPTLRAHAVSASSQDKNTSNPEQTNSDARTPGDPGPALTTRDELYTHRLVNQMVVSLLESVLVP